MKPTEFALECNCSNEPCTCHQDASNDDLVHVEIDRDGNTHIWPYTSYMRNRLYHPEWQEGYVEPSQPKRP